jgi:predicted O-methyltransferase YrrM
MLAQRVGVDPRYLRRLRWIHKARAVHRSGGRLLANLPFVLVAPEPDNFTFAIANEPELAAWVTQVAGVDPADARRWIEEPAADAGLLERLHAATAGHWLWTKRTPQFGKRLGWYALARGLKPRLIVEVGAHDGLGSLLLLRALERNAEEGTDGRLASFDVNPTAGWLVGSHPRWDLRIESSSDGLPRLLAGPATLDMFVYDGWHSYEAERRDLEIAAAHLSARGVLVSDDAQVSRALSAVCEECGLEYFEFHERPVGHFHPGAVQGAGRR